MPLFLHSVSNELGQKSKFPNLDSYKVLEDPPDSYLTTSNPSWGVNIKLESEPRQEEDECLELKPIIQSDLKSIALTTLCSVKTSEEPINHQILDGRKRRSYVMQEENEEKCSKRKTEAEPMSKSFISSEQISQIPTVKGSKYVRPSRYKTFSLNVKPAIKEGKSLKKKPATDTCETSPISRNKNSENSKMENEKIKTKGTVLAPKPKQRTIRRTSRADNMVSNKRIRSSPKPISPIEKANITPRSILPERCNKNERQINKKQVQTIRKIRRSGPMKDTTVNSAVKMRETSKGKPKNLNRNRIPNKVSELKKIKKDSPMKIGNSHGECSSRKKPANYDRVIK